LNEYLVVLLTATTKTSQKDSLRQVKN